jgi:chromosome segregation ATPase
MNHKAEEFFESMHAKLETLKGRMECLKLNIGSTCHSLQERLKELRQNREATWQSLTDARIRLEFWLNEDQADVKNTVDRWITNHDTGQLAMRACEA